MSARSALVSQVIPALRGISFFRTGNPEPSSTLYSHSHIRSILQVKIAAPRYFC
jgi:hypothetical protein